MVPFRFDLLVAFCALFAYASAQVTTIPSIAQASDALKAYGAGIGNSPVALGLGGLASSGGRLGQAISDGFSGLLHGIAEALDPELRYSYGGSPPVYPTRKQTSDPCLLLS